MIDYLFFVVAYLKWSGSTRNSSLFYAGRDTKNCLAGNGTVELGITAHTFFNYISQVYFSIIYSQENVLFNEALSNTLVKEYQNSLENQ